MTSAEVKSKKAWWKAKMLEDMKTEKSIKNTAIKTAVETVLSVGVGGAIGSLLGRPSFFVGLTATAAGHYLGIKWLPAVGLGMMASSNPLGVNAVSGFSLSGAKERLNSFKDSLLHRTYLSEVLPKSNKESSETTSGFGNTAEQNQALQDIEKQLVQSAMEYKRNRRESTEGLNDDMQGMDEPDFSGM